MLSKPERKGYVLTEWGEDVYSEWQDIGGCSCHLGGAPCQSCTHEGNPISLEENDEAWYEDIEFNVGDDVKIMNLNDHDATDFMWLIGKTGRVVSVGGYIPDRINVKCYGGLILSLFNYNLAMVEKEKEEDMCRDKIVNKSTTKDSPEVSAEPRVKVGEPRYNIGDKVRILRDTNGSGLSFGDVVSITGHRCNNNMVGKYYYPTDAGKNVREDDVELAEPKLDKQEEKVDTITVSGFCSGSPLKDVYDKWAERQGSDPHVHTGNIQIYS